MHIDAKVLRVGVGGRGTRKKFGQRGSAAAFSSHTANLLMPCDSVSVSFVVTRDKSEKLSEKLDMVEVHSAIRAENEVLRLVSYKNDLCLVVVTNNT